MTGTKTDLTRDNVREVAQLRADGTSWKKIGAIYGVAETTAKTAFTRAVHDLGLLEHPQVAKAIPADLPAAIVAALTEPETSEPAAEQPEILTDEERAMRQDTGSDDGHVVAIVSPEYAETVKKLLADPIIDDMAHGLLGTPQDQLTHPNGGARHEFMIAALHEYNNRGGEVGTHIGGPAEALLVRLAELKVEQQVAEQDGDVDLAEQVGQKVREDNATAKAEADPAPEQPAATGEKHAHCIHCGWKFDQPIARDHCGSKSACEKRQADPARHADKRVPGIPAAAAA